MALVYDEDLGVEVPIAEDDWRERQVAGIKRNWHYSKKCRI